MMIETLLYTPVTQIEGPGVYKYVVNSTTDDKLVTTHPDSLTAGILEDFARQHPILFIQYPRHDDGVGHQMVWDFTKGGLVLMNLEGICEMTYVDQYFEMGDNNFRHRFALTDINRGPKWRNGSLELIVDGRKVERVLDESEPNAALYEWWADLILRGDNPGKLIELAIAELNRLQIGAFANRLFLWKLSNSQTS